MSENGEILELLHKVATGEVTPEAAYCNIDPVENLGFARIDHSRQARCGFPEVIYAENKTPEQCVEITRSILSRSELVLLSRVTLEISEAVCKVWPEAVYNKLGRTVRIGVPKQPDCALAPVLVVSAGTSDLPVAEEALETLRAFGIVSDKLYDTGVAGLHRLLDNLSVLRSASVIIVVAGMEGALPSVIGGLVRCPVIAVPTNVGYGASFNGVAALLGMLNSCASGVGVMNIDNGFGAACLAARILNSITAAKSGKGQYE